MRFVIFTHSLVSDWNHGNAHFLRGIASELLALGNQVQIYEPRDGWSRRNMMADAGPEALEGFERAYPGLRSMVYDADTLNPAQALEGADVALVHEWNAHELVARLGEYRRWNPHFQLYFHDTHHRSLTDPRAMAAYDLRYYDAVLAYGDVIRDIYLRRQWARDAWTWHEAADTNVFYPRQGTAREGDLVWIGNWGDGERSHEIREFLIEPVRRLGLKARVYGVRYPREALEELSAAGIEYGGWLPNYRVPEVFAGFRVTFHIPRGPYARLLPGIPTIRPFEALACGIPLVSAPWQGAEQMFRPGRDFLFARDREQMIHQLRRVIEQPELARQLAASGLETIGARHTCALRAGELLAITGCGTGRTAVQGAD